MVSQGDTLHTCMHGGGTSNQCVLATLQDGQEFSKLLLNLLETKLAGSPNPVSRAAA